jgi:hypothetical protein
MTVDYTKIPQNLEDALSRIPLEFEGCSVDLKEQMALYSQIRTAIHTLSGQSDSLANFELRGRLLIELRLLSSLRIENIRCINDKNIYRKLAIGGVVSENEDDPSKSIMDFIETYQYSLLYASSEFTPKNIAPQDNHDALRIGMPILHDHILEQYNALSEKHEKVYFIPYDLIKITDDHTLLTSRYGFFCE